MTLNVEAIKDGQTVPLPKITLYTTNFYFKIAQEQNLMIKIPTDYGITVFSAYYISEEKGGAERPVRFPHADEQFEQLAQMLVENPEFVEIQTRFSPFYAYFLLVHKMQYKKLKVLAPLSIPEVKFVDFKFKGIFSKKRIGFIQKLVPGINYYGDLSIEPDFQQHKTTIHEQLQPFLDSEEVDYNPTNFIFDPDKNRLHYVDLKPSVIVEKATNDKNKRGLLKYF